jgi:hypothetical protein
MVQLKGGDTDGKEETNHQKEGKNQEEGSD